VVVPPVKVLLLGETTPIVAGVTVALIDVPSASTVPSCLLTDTVRIVNEFVVIDVEPALIAMESTGVAFERALAAAAAAAATCQAERGKQQQECFAQGSHVESPGSRCHVVLVCAATAGRCRYVGL
jgi:hypothetical protein